MKNNEFKNALIEILDNYCIFYSQETGGLLIKEERITSISDETFFTLQKILKELTNESSEKDNFLN